MLGISAFALALTAYGAQADVLPVQNLLFDDFNSPSIAPKSIFTNANPVGWTGGTGLISIDAPGTADQVGNGGGNPYAVAGPFADPPPGGLHPGGRQSDVRDFVQSGHKQFDSRH
jgi:hypothetical protein